MPEAPMDRPPGKASDPDRKHPLYNTNPYPFARLLGDTENFAPNLVSYISGFSPTARRRVSPQKRSSRSAKTLYHAMRSSGIIVLTEATGSVLSPNHPVPIDLFVTQPLITGLFPDRQTPVSQLRSLSAAATVTTSKPC